MRLPMRRWRAILVATALLGFFLILLDALDTPNAGSLPFATTPFDRFDLRRDVVTRVLVPTAAPGIAAGDVIELFDDSLAARIELDRRRTGALITWNVQRGLQHSVAQSRMVPPDPSDVVIYAAYDVVRLAMIAVALLVAIRRPDAAQARALASFLVAFGCSIGTNSPWLPGYGYLALRIILPIALLFGVAQMTEFACTFPQPSVSGVRRWIRRLSPWYAVAVAGASVGVTIAAELLEHVPEFSPLLVFGEYGITLYFVAITVAFVIGARDVRGPERMRVRWASGSFGIAFLGPLALFLTNAFHVRGAWLWTLPLTLIIAPVGLAYTILRHRTIDIGFVLNRALGFAIVSALVVGAFGVLEWALSAFFVRASHLTSTALEIALAVTVGFSLRAVHGRVENIVDNVFFRERHLAEAALRAFALDVGAFTSPRPLLDQSIAMIERFAEATEPAIYLRDGTRYRAVAGHGTDAADTLDDNDPLIVRLRSARASVHITRDLSASLHAERAFPMFVRGALAGVLVVGPKRSGEAYAPDEIAILNDVARVVGTTLDMLHTEGMKREIDRVLLEGCSLDVLRTAWQSLPQSLSSS